jgi:hypothetical protein
LAPTAVAFASGARFSYYQKLFSLFSITLCAHLLTATAAERVSAQGSQMTVFFRLLFVTNSSVHAILERNVRQYQFVGPPFHLTVLL